MNSKTKKLVRYGNKYNLPDGFIYGYDNGLLDPRVRVKGLTGSIGITGHQGQPGTPGLNYREYIAWCRKNSINKIFNPLIIGGEFISKQRIPKTLLTTYETP